MRGYLKDLVYKSTQEVLVDQLIGSLSCDLYDRYTTLLNIEKIDYGNHYGIDIKLGSKEVYHLHPEDILNCILNYKTCLKTIITRIKEVDTNDI